MKTSQSIISVLAASTLAIEAYQPSSSSSSRRAFVHSAAAFVATTTAGSVAANAIDTCPKGSNNCIRTSWTPPEGTSQADMAKSVKALLEAYPQEGQSDVDKGGWTIVSEDLAGSGKAAVEYRSGIGNFAKFLNGGKPFVDDLVLEIKDGAVQVRSSSRVGDSDFKVNQKRLQFLADGLRSMGWEAPDPKY